MNLDCIVIVFSFSIICAVACSSITADQEIDIAHEANKIRCNALLPHFGEEPEPVKFVEVKGAQILVNGKPTFLVGQMDYNVTTGRTPEAMAEILDVMMVPYGMNLLMARLGIISWGEWNNIVNMERGLEEERIHYRYPYVFTETGQTNFGTHQFDLDRFDESFFNRTRRIIELANERGIVPVVGLFSEHAIDHPLHWRGHPFNPANNVNDLGLPPDRAIPEYFENPKALALQEAYVRRLLSEIDDLAFILEPFGEVNKAPDAYINHWLRLFEQHEAQAGRPMLVCLSGRKAVLDRFAADPAVDLIDVYCYHDGQYDGPDVNRATGEKGVFCTVTEAVRLYKKPVTKLYFKYGYPYADPHSPWADPKTGTQGGGDPVAAREALEAVERAGGAGLYFKMAWSRDRGTAMTPDLWSDYILEFVAGCDANSWQTRTQRP